jgi:transposase
MKRGRPRPATTITAEQRQQLEDWTRRRTTAQALARRASMVLLSLQGVNDVQIARRLHTTRETVGRWRRRFLSQGVDGLLDEPRPGAPRTISDQEVERVVTLTLESKPDDATHWSTRAMAKRCGMSQTAISRIWRAFALQPHRSETFKLSKDPLFVDKVRDIVGLYLSPPEKALVLCVDEKSQIQALDRTAPLLPMRPGQIERRTHDYKRHGTTSLFAALDVATGKVIGDLHRRHRAMEFRNFLDAIDAAVGKNLQVHLILDKRNSQNSFHSTLACQAPSLSFAFHTYRCLVDQLSGEMVCGTYQQATPSRSTPEYPRTGGRHPRLSQHQQSESKAFHLDQKRR